MKREPSAWGYNWATLLLGDINTELGPPGWGSLESETVKYSHEFRWRGSTAIVNDIPILSLERTLHKDYDRKCSVERKIWP
jgi:hypothetical protein